MADRGINRHTLAAQSGIPYTTIIGFYTKGYDKAQLSTLKRLCRYFNVTLDYLVAEDDQAPGALPPGEQTLLTVYRSLNADGQTELIRYADYCSSRPEFQKNTPAEAE